MPLHPSYQPAPAWPSLGPAFADPARPASFPRHALRFRNDRAAEEVGLHTLTGPEWVTHFGELAPLPRNLDPPLALRYHGHQFQSYNPYLGDGRGFLHSQLLDRRGRVLDLGTKGSGTTPYSRGGDGRLTLKGAVREILATELLEALGVTTSRTLSVIETGEDLVRHDEPSPTRGAVLVRLSHGHVRFGTFQRQAYERSPERVARLLQFAIDSYFPALAEADAPDPAAAFLDLVVGRCARLVAQWTLAGFVHGVLNTDNMNITGESFDYGPWRFLPTYDPSFVAAYFDHSGLYAFARQGDAVAWNLVRLAETLLPLSSETALTAPLASFIPRLHAATTEQLRWRLHLRSAGDAADRRLLATVFAFLQASQCPYERFFFDWFSGEAAAARALSGPEAARYAGPQFDALRAAFSHHEPVDAVAPAAPYFGGEAPVTMRIEEMEALWAPIATTDDWEPLYAGLAAIRAFGAVLPPAPGTEIGARATPRTAGR